MSDNNLKVPSAMSILSRSMVGVIAQGSTWPIEYAKTIKQFEGGGERNVYRVLKNDISRNGFTGLYRGLIPQISSSAPRFAARFTIYENLIKMTNEVDGDTEFLKLLSGVLAGSIEAAVFMTPAEAIKVKVIKEKSTNTEIMRTIYRENGLGGFWRGGVPTTVRQGMTQGVSLYVNSLLNPVLHPYLGSLTGLGVGVVSGVTAVAVSNPVDVIKTRQQERSNKVSIGQEMKSIIQSDGILGFYRGGLLRSSRMVPLHSLTYLVYDMIARDDP